MARRTALLLTLLLLGPVPGLAEDRDADTLAGMDALVTDRWVAAVLAFTKALAAAPEDEARQARLGATREAGGYYWAARAEECADRDRWRHAAVCAGLARFLDPARPEVVEIVKRVEEKHPIPDVSVPLAAVRAYPGRCPDVRLMTLSRLGPSGERAAGIVEGCLTWLLEVQEKNGGWICEKHGGQEYYDAGVTGLALSALLTEGATIVRGPRGPALAKAADYLVAAQSKSGLMGFDREHHFIYSHAAATEALATYATLSGETERYRAALTKARDFLLRAQNAGAGWRYGVRPGENDTSVTYWAVAALKAIRLAGLPVDPEGFSGARAWVSVVTEREYGRTGYTQKGNGPARLKDGMETWPPDKSEALTAAGLLIRRYTGDTDRDLTAKQLSLLARVPPFGN
ncbi:MAG: prenyltransferase/squalene oxidase repeat-containing protein, partial [Planctomycetota bacterium]